MRQAFARTDKSLLGQWWWTVDRSLLISALLLMGIGVFLSFSSSPVVASRIGADPYFFVKRHLIYIFPSVLLMLFISLLSVRQMRYLCWAGFALSFILLLLTPFIGREVKGAVRWIQISSLSIQVAEFLKPFYAIISAWILSKNTPDIRQKTWLLSTILTVLTLFFLMLQPDFGMAFVIASVWGIQIFLAGLPLWWLLVLCVTGSIGVVASYLLFDHVASRINRFLGLAQDADLYQIQQSLECIKHGGFFGQGPGEGHFKLFLPDAHADFVFAVAIEEFGLILGVFILIIFSFIIIKSSFYYFKENSLFQKLALMGIIMQYALQVVINISSTLSLIPTKGMTLPFISYGGSSLLGVSIGMGIILSLTKNK